MRPRIRHLAIVLAAFGAVSILAVPAEAKGPGEHDVVEGKAVITGPGLKGPVSIEGSLNLFEPGAQDDFALLFAGAGLRPYDLTVDGWYDLEPDASTLGPRFEITYTFADPSVSGPIVQDAYPYADGGRPWFFVHPHQYSPMFGNRPVPVGAALARGERPARPKRAPLDPASGRSSGCSGLAASYVRLRAVDPGSRADRDAGADPRWGGIRPPAGHPDVLRISSPSGRASPSARRSRWPGPTYRNPCPDSGAEPPGGTRVVRRRPPRSDGGLPRPRSGCQPE